MEETIEEAKRQFKETVEAGVDLPLRQIGISKPWFRIGAGALAVGGHLICVRLGAFHKLIDVIRPRIFPPSQGPLTDHAGDRARIGVGRFLRYKFIDCAALASLLRHSADL